MASLEKLLKGVKSVQAKRTTHQRTRLPITTDILRRIRQQLKSGAYEEVLVWAVCTLCFFGFFRAGELMVAAGSFDSTRHLAFKDIAVDSLVHPTLLRVHLKASKTDPFRQGVDVFVGKTENDLCPIQAMTAYLATRGGAEGPLFKWRDGRPLTRPQFVSKVRALLQASGLDASLYAGHSFRSGAATSAARQGINDATIQLLGRWKSNAYQLYVKTPRGQLAAFSRTLAS